VKIEADEKGSIRQFGGLRVNLILHLCAPGKCQSCDNIVKNGTAALISIFSNALNYLINVSLILFSFLGLQID